MIESLGHRICLRELFTNEILYESDFQPIATIIIRNSNTSAPEWHNQQQSNVELGEA